jgi:hypothetical protein
MRRRVRRNTDHYFFGVGGGADSLNAKKYSGTDNDRNVFRLVNLGISISRS